MIALAAEFDKQAWLDFAASLHPAVLHLPIGLWFGVAALEFGSMLIRKPTPRGSIATLAWLAALTGAAAAGSGWLLGAEGGYHEEKLDLHRWLGVGVGGLGLLAAFFAASRSRGIFRILLLVALGLLGAAGHFGGELTHGSNFLKLPWAQPAKAANPADETASTGQPSLPENTGPTYATAIAPIFERTCVACHGPEKMKAELRLDSREGIETGSELGPVFVPGKPNESILLELALLPLEDEDHMPPEGKPQPTAAELALLRAWIAAGAPFEDAFAAPEPVDDGAPSEPEPDEPKPDEPEKPRSEKPKIGKAPVDDQLLQSLRDRHVFVEPAAGTEGLLRIDAAAAAKTFDDQRAVSLLLPLVSHVVDLGLARAAVGDATAALCARMPNLRTLDLRATAVTSEGVAALDGHASLRSLNLAQTAVDDDAVAALQNLPSLERLFVWKTALSAEAIATLRSRDGMRVNAGDVPLAEVLETEGELSFVNELPVPGAGKGAAAQKPTNELCPITGKPVDPRYTLEHDGKVIGFCCPNCVEEFRSKNK